MIGELQALGTRQLLRVLEAVLDGFSDALTLPPCSPRGYHLLPTLLSQCSGVDANEDLRATYPSRKSNPHDRGCVANWKACLFGKTPPSYVLQLDREELLGDVEMARTRAVDDEFRDAKDVV